MTRRPSNDMQELTILSFLDRQVFAPGRCSGEEWTSLTAHLAREGSSRCALAYTLFEERLLPASATLQMSEEQLLAWLRQVPAILNAWRQGGRSHILMVLPAGNVALAVTVLACVYGALHMFPPCILLDERGHVQQVLRPTRMYCAGSLLKTCSPAGDVLAAGEAETA
jgi:hypothetical protein